MESVQQLQKALGIPLPNTYSEVAKAIAKLPGELHEEVTYRYEPDGLYRQPFDEAIEMTLCRVHPFSGEDMEITGYAHVRDVVLAWCSANSIPEEDVFIEPPRNGTDVVEDPFEGELE